MAAKRLVIFVSAKGGTGKTFAARHLADLYHRLGTRVILVDADRDVAQFQQYYRDAIPLEPTDVAALLNIVTLADAPIVLVDMPGRGLEDLSVANKEASMFQWLAEHGVAVTMINVVTPYRGSTRSVGTMLNVIGDANVTKIAFLNQKFGPHKSDWVLWYGDEKLRVKESPSRRRFLASGGIEIAIPEIRTTVPVLLDVRSETFSHALSSNESLLKTADLKQYLLTWRREMDNALKPAKKGLGL